MSRVGILGGSFDPIHKGHIHIAKLVKEQLNLDKILLIPNKVSPFKTSTPPVDFEHRYKMCQIACSEYPDFEVSDIENTLSEPSYTIHTIQALKQKSEDEYYFIVGSDQAKKLKEWRDIDELCKLVTFVVVDRDGKNIQCDVPYVKVDGLLHQASSQRVRSGSFIFVDEKVRQYIFDHELYIRDIVRSKMSDRRYAHSLSVRNVAMHLAKIHGLDEHKASLAALLHDIAKEFDDETVEKYMSFETKEHQAMPKPVLHQYVGASYVKNILRLYDEDIYNAIYYHTTGGCDNPYVYIVFIADKIEPTRGYDATLEMSLAQIDLKTAYDYVLRKQREYIKKGK
ncbi:MAG: nicotinate (nicotinamide) nucleotide adenylyltransferase [Erysipelotrichaceae bacterium]|nr:nicotinate (nicotinamide) nucleotide adenylyltransferase [Erysipelotrichaceae bacterium]MBR3692981.1 nicotinate (nicotinamide) nucleotide adenylyltransferase [Erysipelotrichales bacterium]